MVHGAKSWEPLLQTIDESQTLSSAEEGHGSRSDKYDYDYNHDCHYGYDTTVQH